MLIPKKKLRIATQPTKQSGNVKIKISNRFTSHLRSIICAVQYVNGLSDKWIGAGGGGGVDTGDGVLRFCSTSKI